MIRVVNKSKHSPTPNDFYIGRGSALGNPYTGSKELSKTKALYQCDTREEAISNFRGYLEEKIKDKDSEICNMLNEIFIKAKDGDVNLVCYCKPKECHGDIIKEVVESKLILKIFKK